MGRIATGAVALVWSCAQAQAQVVNYVETHQLFANDGQADDRFGNKVAIQGDLVVVGAEAHDVDNANSGAAYVFMLDDEDGGYTELAKLVVSDRTNSDLLGSSVAIHGDIIVVGADQAYSNNQGRAYVYIRPEEGWAGIIEETAQLRASNRGSSDYFGASVDVEGNTIVVGAYGEDEAASAAGALYVFEEPKTGWDGILEENAKLIPSIDPGNIGYLGLSVDLQGDVIVGSVYRSEVDGNDGQGRGYVFVRPRGGWEGTLTETAELLASDGGANDRLGRSVAIDGSTIVLGANLWEPPGGNANNGAVYVYEEPAGGWAGTIFESAQLFSSSPVSQEFLGVSVDIEGELVVAGTDKDGTNARESVYVFERPMAGWSGMITEAQRFEDEVAGENSFGAEVRLESGRIAVGSQRDDTVDSNAGAVYVYAQSDLIFEDDFELADLELASR